MEADAQAVLTIAVVSTLVATPAAGLPVQGELRVNLVPGGGAPTQATWSETGDATCQEVPDGQPGPAQACAVRLEETGEQFCENRTLENGTNETTCHSYAYDFADGGGLTNFTVPPADVGEVAAGWEVQSYELSFDYRLEIAGAIQGSSEDRYGYVDSSLTARILTSPNGAEVWEADEIDQFYQYTCCGDEESINGSTAWKSTGPIPVRDEAGGDVLAAHGGDTLTLEIGTDCYGNADQDDGELGEPVTLDVDCRVVFDNVRLDVVYRTP